MEADSRRLGRRSRSGQLIDHVLLSEVPPWPHEHPQARSCTNRTMAGHPKRPHLPQVLGQSASCLRKNTRRTPPCSARCASSQPCRGQQAKFSSHGHVGVYPDLAEFKAACLVRRQGQQTAPTTTGRFPAAAARRLRSPELLVKMRSPGTARSTTAASTGCCSDRISRLCTIRGVHDRMPYLHDLVPSHPARCGAARHPRARHPARYRGTGYHGGPRGG